MPYDKPERDLKATDEGSSWADIRTNPTRLQRIVKALKSKGAKK
jgi:hypothetical protein